PPPSSLAPDCPPELDAVVLRALARNPDDRWPTARAFGDALDAVAKEKGSTTPRPALEEHMEALFLPILTTRRTTVRSLVECPPARPMMLSEVEVVSRPSPTSERPTIDVDIEVPREPLLARRRLRRALAAGGAVVALFSLATILALGHGDALAPATPLGELDRPASFAPVRLTHADFVVRNAAVEPESEPTPASHTVATKEATPKMLPARLRPSLPAVPPNPYAP
ncbi:MAG TPA: hypothetical protein VF407_10365, partial [Polyangiaceae bacterium]